MGDHAYEARKAADDLPDTYRDKYLSSLAVKGWVRAMSGSDAYLLESDRYFDRALRRRANDIEALLGRAKYHELTNKPRAAIEVLNKVVVSYPEFYPVLIDKAKMLLRAGEWDQARETCRRVIEKFDRASIDARMYSLLFLAVREYSADSAALTLDRLVTAIDRREPRNHRLMYKVCKTMSCLFSREPKIVATLLKLIGSAQKRPHVSFAQLSDYLTLEGNLLLMKNEYKTAEAAFTKALEYEESNLAANRGRIRCFLATNHLEDARRHLEFLSDLESTVRDGIGGSSELAYLAALCSRRSKRPSDECVKLLDKAFDHFEREITGKRPSFEFYAICSARFLLELSREYRRHCPVEPVEAASPRAPVLDKALKALEVLANYVPGCIEGRLMFARVKYLAREFERVRSILAKVLKLNPALSEAHMLAANVAYMQEDFVGAANHLERALSFDFDVKELVTYNLLRAKINAATGDLDGALRLLTYALRGVDAKDSKRQVTVHDNISLYMELADVHQRMGHDDEADRAIKSALHKFKNTPEEGRIVIGKAKILAKRNEVDEAMRVLGRVKQGTKYFLKAKTEIAYMHLHLRNDKKAFARCFEELVARDESSVAAYAFLGDAYTSINRPDKAIDVFKKALAIDPENASLRSKIANAYIVTHNYADAVRYYRDALTRNPERMELMLDFANLCIRLRRFGQAERILTDGIAALSKRNELSSVMLHVKALLYLYRVRKAAALPGTPAHDGDLRKAKDIQDRVLNKLRGGRQETIYIRKRIAAGICFDLGKMSLERRRVDAAIDSFNEALRYDETHEASMLSLARIFLSKNNTTECAKHCKGLLRRNPSHQTANIIMADLMFRENNFAEAIGYFKGILDGKPDNFNALHRLIVLLRRAGKVTAAEKFLKAAEDKCRKEARIAPGLFFCRGLYSMYRNSPRDALERFNHSRMDPEWGEQSLLYMIDIYLNPEILLRDGTAAGIHAGRPSASGGPRAENVQAAEKLFAELKASKFNTVPERKKTVQEAYVLLARDGKGDVDAALRLLVPLIREDKDDVPALVAIAHVFNVRKRELKVKSNLKRIVKADYDRRYADDFERGWLLLAELYVNAANTTRTTSVRTVRSDGNRTEQARELLKVVLRHNKSCHRAWDLLGLILEKAAAYRDAAECYENAWRLTDEKDPKIGYKFAFNLLRSKRNVSAIDVCHKILRRHPDFPRIKKEVLDKARLTLRGGA